MWKKTYGCLQSLLRRAKQLVPRKTQQKEKQAFIRAENESKNMDLLFLIKPESMHLASSGQTNIYRQKPLGKYFGLTKYET